MANFDNKDFEAQQKVVGELKSVRDNIKTLLDSQNADIKKYGETTSQVASKMQDLENKNDSLEREFADLNKMVKNLEEFQSKNQRPDYESGREFKSLGQAIARSAELAEAIKTKRYDTNIQLGSLKNYIPTAMETKSVTGSTYLRDIMATLRLQEIYYDPLRPNRIRDLFPVIPTKDSAVSFIRETVYDLQSGMVAEGTQKPESNITFAEFSQPVQVLAHSMPVPRQLLSDINQLEGYLDQRMLIGLKQTEDTQLLYGSGNAPDIAGIFNVSGIQTYNWSSGTVGDTYIDAVRKAITKAQLAYYPVSGIGMHPTAWQTIELQKATGGLYVWVNIATGAGPQLWKVPIVTSTAFTANQALLGSFNLGAAIYDREEANMRVSEHHLDNFTKNMVTFLLEERFSLVTYRPKSFVNLTFDSAPVS